MIKRIWKVIVLFGSMLLICGCGKEKLSEEDILQKINTTGEYGENLEWQLYDGAFGITLAIGGSGQMDDYSEELFRGSQEKSIFWILLREKV